MEIDVLMDKQRICLHNMVFSSCALPIKYSLKTSDFAKTRWFQLRNLLISPLPLATNRLFTDGVYLYHPLRDSRQSSRDDEA